MSNPLSRTLAKLGKKIGLINERVPILCHNCGQMVGIRKTEIARTDQGDSPCCGSTFSPPPSRMEAGKIWDNMGGQRYTGEDTADPKVSPESVIEGLEDIRENNRR
jgi:hypothetical protein